MYLRNSVTANYSKIENDILIADRTDQATAEIIEQKKNDTGQTFKEINWYYLFADDETQRLAKYVLLQGDLAGAQRSWLDYLNQFDKAVTNSKGDVQKINPSTEKVGVLKAKIYNNLALTFYLQGNCLRAKEFINNAGVILSSYQEVTNNNRLISSCVKDFVRVIETK